MDGFQEQTKNRLRNVVKQNPDKNKAGVEKAGDVIDKQTGGKYTEKVDTVQQKVGQYVESQSGHESEPSGSGQDAPEQPSASEQSTGNTESGDPATGPDDGAP